MDHLTTETASAVIGHPGTERFIVLCGKLIEPWVACDQIFKMDRLTTIEDIAVGEPISVVTQVLAFDLAIGKIRDATREIAEAVMDRWTDDGEPLTDYRKYFIEQHSGIQATPLSPADHQAAQFDHARELRKEVA